VGGIDGGPGVTRAARTFGFAMLSIATGLVLWEWAARDVPRAVFSPPSAVLARLGIDIVNGTLPLALLHSLVHLAVGFLLALAIAIPLGFAVGRSARVAAFVEPVLNALYALPPVALVPFLIIWFGLMFEARAALVFVMCFFEILVTVAAGARNIEPSLLAVGRSFGAQRLRLVANVMLPASLPFLLTAVRVGLVRAINAMITAELFFAAVNVGQLMKHSAQKFDTAGLLADIVMLCLLGLAAQEGLKHLEARLLPWHVRT
jgi:ABC-type nitrate/sulfonate/bicarbonate transport system permease component